jgi:hypothetical protein
LTFDLKKPPKAARQRRLSSLAAPTKNSIAVRGRIIEHIRLDRIEGIVTVVHPCGRAIPPMGLL